MTTTRRPWPSTICRTLLSITWALWFGGVMGLFLSVQVLFHQTERSIFLAAAPRLFIAFERYQIVLAALSLVLTFIWRLLEPLSRATTVFIVLAIASITAVIESTLITPRIERLRIQGATHTQQFMRLHGLSMCLYMAIAMTLLVVGVLLASQSPRVDYAQNVKSA